MTEHDGRAGQDPISEINYWSTQGVASEKKTEFWVDAVCAAFFRMVCRPRSENAFEGSLASIQAAEFSLSRAVASAQQLANSPQVSDPERQVFYLTTDVRNAWAINQDGRRSQLKAGDLALIDSRKSTLSEFPGGTNTVTIALPLTWVQDWLAVVDAPGCRVISGERGWGKILSATCAELGSNLLLASQTSPKFLSDHLGGLLAAALEPSPMGTCKDVDLFQRAQAAMHERLGESALSAHSLAAQLQISVRTLHRSFSAQGATFAAALRQMRLQRAVRLLENPRLAGLPVAEIASRSGFQSSSHFIREFRRQWGSTPGRWRQNPPGKVPDGGL